MSEPDELNLTVRYTGNGEHVLDVPARDMTLEEWELLPLRLRYAARHLYTGIPAMDEQKPEQPIQQKSRVRKQGE